MHVYPYILNYVSWLFGIDYIHVCVRRFCSSTVNACEWLEYALYTGRTLRYLRCRVLFAVTVTATLALHTNEKIVSQCCLFNVVYNIIT